MDSPTFLRPICLGLAALAILAGGLGMRRASLPRLQQHGRHHGRHFGFVAGAVLIAAGLLSLTMLATRPARSESKESDYLEIG